jgi:rubrerythrin
VTKANQAGELLELSLGFEQNARELYKKWSVTFAGEPDVAAFWSEYAADEDMHAHLLDELRSRLSADELATLIKSELVGDTRRMLVYLQKDPNIRDLDQAFQYANMIEHSEVNPLFEEVLSAFEQDVNRINLLRTQLSEHIGKLINKFPKRFSSAELRRAVKVQP